MVGEYLQRCEVLVARRNGALRSKNVGTSNHNPDEISGRRKLKVSWAMIVSSGLVGPKVMAKAGADGHTVNIP